MEAWEAGAAFPKGEAGVASVGMEGVSRWWAGVQRKQPPAGSDRIYVGTVEWQDVFEVPSASESSRAPGQVSGHSIPLPTHPPVAPLSIG